MKKMKFFAMAFAAIFAVAFSACKPQNEPNKPDDGGNGDGGGKDQPTQIEAKLGGIIVDTYYGEAFSIVENAEAYTIIFTNEKENTTYSISLSSYPNKLAAPVEGKYAVVKEISTTEQAAVTKIIGEGEDAVKVSAENGDVTITGTAAEMEITATIKFADSEKQGKLHYKGAVQVKPFPMEMYLENEKLTITSMTLDQSEENAKYNLYTFMPKKGDVPAQGELSAIVSSPQYPNGFMQLILSYLFKGENKDATKLPTGEFPFYNMYKDGEATGDCITASDYLIYDANRYGQITGQYYFSSEIYTITANSLTNIFYPQTGTLKIEAGSKEGTMKFTINATSFNGSTFKGTFELPERVAPTSAPQRLAPKADKQWGRMLPVKEFPAAFKRAM